MSIKEPVFSAFNPYIEKLPVYNAGLSIGKAREISGKHEIARLASNENPYGCSPAVKESLVDSGYEPWRYPDSHCRALKQALADSLGVDPGNVVVGNGSEEIISAISRAVLQPGDEVVTVTPSFGLHEIEPLAVGARVTKIPLTAELEFNVGALHEAILRRPKLVFLSSPSNPVGCILNKEDLELLLSAVSNETLFVLDEAYYEYAAKELPDSMALLQTTKAPMVVLRTFSKAYGLAGLRVGYGITQSADMAKAISLARTPFNVNGVAQQAALAALADQQWMQDRVECTTAERCRIISELTKMGFKVSASRSNSVFIDMGVDSGMAFEQLVKEGVIVKPWRESGYDQYVRVSVGTPRENDFFLHCLAKLFSEVRDHDYGVEERQ